MLGREGELEIQVALLKDMLETAHSNMNKARDEAAKADEEAMYLKTNRSLQWSKEASEAHHMILHWKGRAEVAEAALKSTAAQEGGE